MLSYIVGYSVWVRSWKYDRRWGWNVIYWINVPLKCHFPIILFRLPTFDLSHRKKNSLGGNDWIPYQQVWLWKEILIFCVMLAHFVSLVDYWGLSGLQRPETKAWIKPVFTDGKSLTLPSQTFRDWGQNLADRRHVITPHPLYSPKLVLQQ